jgi:hypothetical protein
VPVDSLTARVTTGNYGKPASVLYGGPVPTLVAGVGQINLRLPADVPGGTDSVSIISGTRPGNGSAIYIALGTPVVRSLSTVPKANTTETVTFSGDGFDGNAVLNLYRDGQFVSAPPNAGTNALTRTSLTKRVTWGAAGRWEVEVVNPSGRKSPRFAFDVVE